MESVVQESSNFGFTCMSLESRHGLSVIREFKIDDFE